MRTSFGRPTSAILLVLLCSTLTFHASAAPLQDDAESQEVYYINDEAGCYYNFQHYSEGDRIVTNEPCLNCTCHNRMLMCYLRVCPFSKAIGQDCTVEKHPDQCCPIISCPEVPVKLLTSTTEQPTTTTAVGAHDNYGCTIRSSFYADGVQVPSDHGKPCELCYCIRNRTACVMQECTLHVEGCRPVYQDGVCCPVRYECDYEDKESSSASYLLNGTSVLTTAAPSLDCKYLDDVFADGESIATDKPCEHCYCMRGDIVCAVQDCGEPLRGKDCTPLPVPPGQCCPASYTCANETVSYQDPDQSNDIITQVQGIINSIKDDTRPDMMENTAEIINPEEVMAPGVLPSDESEVESHESNYVSTSDSDIMEANPGALHDHVEVVSETSNIKESEKPSETSDILVPDSSSDSHAAQELSTSAPMNELDSALSNNVNNDVEPQGDVLKVSSTPVSYETPSSPNPDSEISQSTSSSISSDSSQHSEPTKDVSIPSESESPMPSASSNAEISPETNYDSADTNESSQTTLSPVVVESIPDAAPSEDAYVEIGATEAAIKDTVPSKQPEDVLAPVVGNASPIESNSLGHDGVTSVIQDEVEVHTKSPQVTEAEISNYNHEPSSTVVAHDKIDTVTPSQSAVVENTPGPSDVHLDEVHQDFPIHDEEDAADLKPNEVGEQDDTVAEVHIPDTEDHRIPGEGNCLIDGKTYTNTSTIPTSNPCHVKCECISSIPSCTMVNCPPPPPQHKKCEPVQPGRDTCCPTYACAVEDTFSLEAHNQVSSELQPTTAAAIHKESSIESDSSTPVSIQAQDETDQQPFISSSLASDIADQHEVVTKPAETSEIEKVTASRPVVIAEADQNVEIAETKLPEYVPTTSYEAVDTTVQPFIQDVTEPAASHVEPNVLHDSESIVQSNLNADVTSGTSSNNSLDSFVGVPSAEVSNISGDSQDQNVDKPSYTTSQAIEITTPVFTEYATSEPASVDGAATPTKTVLTDETNVHSEAVSNTNDAVVSSTSSPEVAHDGMHNLSEQLGVNEKESVPVNPDIVQSPVLDQQENEQGAPQSEDGTNDISESLSPLAQDTVVYTLNNVPETNETPAETTVAAEDKPEVATETQTGDIIVTEQPVFGASDESGSIVEGESGEKVTESPSVGDDSVNINYPQTETPVLSSDNADVPVAPSTHDEGEESPQNVKEPPSDAAVTSGDVVEISTEEHYETTVSDKIADYSNESASAQPEVSSKPEVIQSDLVGVPYDASSQPAVQPAAEDITQAPPVSDIIYHDEHIHSHKPESDSSIYLPSSVPERDNSISVPNTVAQSPAETSGDSAQAPGDIASESDMINPDIHEILPEISHDHPVSAISMIPSDSSSDPNKDSDVLKDPAVTAQVSPQSVQPSSHDSADSYVTIESTSTHPDQHADTQSLTSTPSHINEQYDAGNLNEESMNTHALIDEEPSKSSTEINYYDSNSDVESTVAPLGIPGEAAAIETVAPLITDNTDVHHEDPASELVTDSYPQTAEPEVNASLKPESYPEASLDEVVGASAQPTETPINIPETTVIPAADEKPSAVVDENIGVDSGVSQSPMSSYDEKEPDTAEQTTLAAVDVSDKIPEAIDTVPQATPVETSETNDSGAPSVSDETPNTMVSASQSPDTNVQTEKDEPSNTVEEKLTYSTEAPVISTDIPLVSLNNALNPEQPESGSLTHESPITSVSEDSNVDAVINHSTETSVNQDSLSSTPQQDAESLLIGVSEANSDVLGSIPSSSAPELVPQHEDHIPASELPVNEIVDSSLVEVPAQTIPEVTNNQESSVETGVDKETTNAISSQSNANAQSDSNNTEPSLPQYSESTSNIEPSTVIPALSPESTLSQHSPLPPLESDSRPEIGSPVENIIGSSSETPSLPPVVTSDYESHETVSEVSSQDSNAVSSVQTGSHSEPESESAVAQEPLEASQEIVRPSDPVTPDNINSYTPTEKPGQPTSQTDLLTSIIQGHLDQNKPHTGFGSVIDSQLSELINRVSTSTPVPTASSSTPHDAILQSSWTPKPMPPQPEDASHRPGEEEPFPADVEYEEDEEGSFGPGTCKYLGKLYVSAQQIPRDDPCDFCFCFRSDIICLQQSCPPPIFGCRQESIQGFCCPRYECPVSKALAFNTSTTSTTTTTLPPHFNLSAYGGNAVRSGCALQNHGYKVGEVIREASGPCRQCICGADGQMKCEPKVCSPEPMIRKMMEEVASQRR